MAAEGQNDHDDRGDNSTPCQKRLYHLYLVRTNPRLLPGPLLSLLLCGDLISHHSYAFRIIGITNALGASELGNQVLLGWRQTFQRQIPPNREDCALMDMVWMQCAFNLKLAIVPKSSCGDESHMIDK